ncbi:MAG: anion permease [Chlamydiia bacterium]|nr:anion permease [Chlamydiia bacterium]
MRNILLGLTLLVGIALWFTPPPEGVSQQAWQLFSIFIATIFGIVSKPMPMGAMAFAGLCAVVLTNTLPFSTAFSGFSNDVVWLIVFAFFVARGFIKTGLGSRISYFFMMLLGKKTLGLGYGLVATEFLLAPAIPSSTARSGGVVLPILDSLAKTFGSYPHDPSSQKMGSFLTKVAAQSSCITSAMFLTSMAANPMIATIAEEMGYEITWTSWILASSVPGIISLLAMPYILYKLYTPTVKESPDAPNFARERLAEMGKMKRAEWIMLGTFILLIVLWVFGKDLSINPATTAMLGLVILLVTEVLTWDDIRKEVGAWETLVWFAILLMMATQLSKLGFMNWLSGMLAVQVQGMSWVAALLILSLTYFYSHYFFASNLAHVGAMYATFLGVLVSLGAPIALSAMILAFFSNLFGALTQYSCGPAAILFGAGYVRIANWWKCGFIASVINIVIWLGVGSVWWKLIGLW